MKSFKELPSCLEIRVTVSNHVIGFRRSNREDVGHCCTFPGTISTLTDLGVSGDDPWACIAAALLPRLEEPKRPLLVEWPPEPR